MNRIGTAFLLLLLSTLGVAGAGCAWIDRTIALRYPGDTSAVVAASDIRVELTDLRPNPSRIGAVRNGFYMHTADVVATNDVAGWIRGGLLQELAAAGVAGSAPLLVRGTIDTVHADAFFEYSATVGLKLSLERDGARLVDGHYSGEGGAGINLSMTEESYHASLNEALSVALRRFVHDVGEALR